MSPNYAPNLLIVVDNNLFDLKIISGIANHAKVFKQILCFSTAESTLDFLVENRNNPRIFPNLILLDIYMLGMDGFEFLEQFEKFPKTVKQKCRIAVLSSSNDFEDMARMEANPNIVDFLKKPLQIRTLKTLIEKIYTT